jgi:hypothetical protein
MFKKSIIVLVLLLIGCYIPTGCAAQPYMGEYLVLSPTTTTKAIFYSNFGDTDPSGLPDDGVSMLANVLSAAGGTSSSHSSLSGYIYQNGFDVRHSGNVYWEPQTWNLSSPVWIPTGAPIYVGSYYYVMFWGKIIVDSANSRIIYKAYVYEDSTDVEHDSPTVYTEYCSISNGDTVLLVGTRTSSTYKYKYLQVGLESNAIITCNWKVSQKCFSYWNGTAWYYDAGNSIRGNKAYITCPGGNDAQCVKVGGNNYTNCYKYYSSNDNVQWYKYTSQYTDDTQLWDGNGSPYMTVTYPYNY